MRVEIEELEPCKKQIKVEIPKERVDETFDRIYNQLRREVTIPGFRPGRAPVSIIKARFKEYVEARVMEELLKEAYEKVLEEHGLRPASDPDFPETSFGEGKPFTFTMVLEVHPDFELKDYSEIEVERKKFVVTDEDVEKFMNELRERFAEYRDKEGPAEMGDVVVLDYEVFEGDNPIEDSKMEGVAITLGAGETVKGFDEQVVGKKAGDEFEVHITFPEDHFDKKVAGKSVVFKCKMKAVKEKVIPELNEEFVKKFGVETVEAFREKCKAELEAKLEKLSKELALSELADKLVEQYDFPVPPSLVEEALNREISNYEFDLRLKGVEPDKEELEKKREELKPEVEKRIRLGYVLRKIAEKEGIEVTRGDVEAHFEELSKRSNLPVEQLVEIVSKTGRMRGIVEDLLYNKVLEELLNRVKVKEVEVKPSEIEEKEGAE